MKQPSWKMPLILSTSLLVLGSFTYWLEFSHKPKKEKEDTATKKPLGLPSETTQIVSFKIKSSTKGLIEGKCDDLAQKKCSIDSNGNWSLTYPEVLKADNENVKSLLSAATSLIATETIDLSDETPEKRKKLLDDYGLSDTKRTDLATQFMELTLEDGKKLTLWFGIEYPLGDKTFAAASVNGNVNEKTIYLVTNYFKNNFDHDLTYFRDKALFSFDRGAIESFKAKTAGGSLVGLKKDGLWLINDLPADYDRIQTLITSIALLKAKGFPQDAPIHGLKPMVSYELKNKTETFHFDLFEKNIKEKKVEHKTYYARSSERKEVVEVDNLILSQTNKKLNELRKGFLLSQAGQVSVTTVDLTGKHYTKPYHFTIGKGEPKELKNLMDSMVSSRIVDFIPAIPAGKSGEITLSFGDQQNPEKYHYRFTRSNKKIYAEDLNAKRKEAFLLSDSFNSALPFEEESWKLK